MPLHTRRLARAGCILLVVILCLAESAPAQAPPRPKKYALLIGLDNYDEVEGVTPLRFAVADANSLKEELALRGYDQVVALLNRDAEREDIVSELYRLASVIKKEDSFLLFYAGHGVRNTIVNDKTYWLTYDARLARLDVGGIRLEHLMDYVRDIKATRKLVLLDHCFSGDLVPGLASATTTRGAGGADTARAPGPALAANTRDGASDNVVLQRNLLPVNFSQQIESRAMGMVVIAAAHDQALESERLGHGVFTAALLQALKTRKADTIKKDAQLSIEEFKKYLFDEVPRLAREVLPGFTQRVTEFTLGVDLNNWFVADNLPVDDIQEADQKVQEYFGILERWAGQSWITVDSKVDCRLYLNSWLNALRAGQPLEENRKNIVAEIRALLERRNFPEDLRAQNLEQYLTSLR